MIILGKFRYFTPGISSDGTVKNKQPFRCGDEKIKELREGLGFFLGLIIEPAVQHGH